MLFSRVLPFIAFSLTMGNFASGKPIVTRSDVTSVQNVFTTLQSNTGTILPQIRSLTAEGDATNESVGPLVIQLSSALQESKDSLVLIGPISSVEGDDTVSELFADIIEDIAGTFGILQANSTEIVDFAGLVSGIDLSLAEVVLGLEVVLAGAVTLVEVLLAGLAAPLQVISFGQTLNVLGLSL